MILRKVIDATYLKINLRKILKEGDTPYDKIVKQSMATKFSFQRILKFSWKMQKQFLSQGQKERERSRCSTGWY